MSLEHLGLLFVLGSACGVVFAPRLLHAIVAGSLFSMALAMTYLRLHAPDIAITEAALGAGLSTLVFLVALRKTQEPRSKKPCSS